MTRRQMRKSVWVLLASFAVIVLMNGCGRTPGYLRPIIGEWVYHSSQKQRWTWEFPDGQTVCFSVDDQKQKWSIKSIRVRGLVVEIDVDGYLTRGEEESSTIKVEILSEDSIFVSSGLHPGLPFERVDE